MGLLSGALPDGFGITEPSFGGYPGKAVNEGTRCHGVPRGFFRAPTLRFSGYRSQPISQGGQPVNLCHADYPASHVSKQATTDLSRGVPPWRFGLSALVLQQGDSNGPKAKG